MKQCESDQYFKNRLSELANRSFSQNIYTFTNFLDLHQLSILNQMKENYKFTTCTTDGGMPSSTRQIARFGCLEQLGFEQNFPIACIYITPKMKKFAQHLTHRDYLGALMNLGIAREMLGDLIMKEEDCYLFCLENIVDFIINDLSYVKHTPVHCTLSTDIPRELLLSLQEVELLVSSERLDGLISKLLQISRSKAALLFQEKKVYINSTLCENSSYVLKTNDIVVIRGYGKFKYEGILSMTKKNKFRVLFQKYC